MEGKKLTKNDFIEIEYIGKIKGGEIFDTNIQEEAKKLNPNIKVKSLVICLGQNMILPAIDKFLMGKEIGRYTLNLKPEKAFGERKRELLKTMPLSVFNKHNINPKPGMVFSFDNLLGRISTVSGGRVIVDFNNPLAGKEIIYELRVKRNITDIKEKVKSLMSSFFRKQFPFEIKGKKLIFEVASEERKFVALFKNKFKEILNLELEFKEEKEK